MSSSRQLPNIVITGTPGTGKSTTAELLTTELTTHLSIPLKHINVGELIKERHLYEKYDNEWDSYIVDDDKVLDELEPMVVDGGAILDWHTCDIYPESWIDLVVVLRCNHTALWTRLEQRGYHLKKIQENNESEIMQTVLGDAWESYASEMVVELQSETTEDLESNVNRIVAWVEAWQKNQSNTST